ncbi:ankyrin-1-like isoform X2 [Phymastichus coffea]|nr:ankyrin-1-like isoform X2 [Phymastichus coffea]XP_058800131.1 ankyrin-1-like isoform X2 [Phymastichus coffea]XP_058800133.1 ankyrin-1-like isoform X2 [Phymastichus coffea]
MSYSKLMEAIFSDDKCLFRSIVENQRWPYHLKWTDYERLVYEAIINNRKNMANLLMDKGFTLYKMPDDSFINSLVCLLLKRCGSSSEYADVIMRYINLGAQVSYQNNLGQTIIHWALINETSGRLIDMMLMKYLEETTVDLCDKSHFSILHIACTRPNVDTVRRLLDCNKNSVNRSILMNVNLENAGYTPLHFAARYGTYEMTEYLLKRGAEVYAQDINGSTPLHLACYRRDHDIIDLILQSDPVTENASDNSGLSHFMVACTGSESIIPKEYLRVAEIRPWSSPTDLIEGRVKDLVVMYGGYTPLHFAAEFGRVNTVNLLLDHGADEDSVTTQKLTASALARIAKHKDVVEILRKE